MNESFRQRLIRGDRLLGSLISLDSPEVAEIMALAGFDWLFLDAEHSPLTTLAMQRLIQAAGPDMPCLVRLADDSQVAIKKALDIGAAGIIVPQVNSAAQAEAIVRNAKYAPQGSRGVGIARAHGYGLGFRDYLDRANDQVAVVVQAEHIEAVNQIEAIIRVPGVDAVLIGPADLSASLGKPGQMSDPEVLAAIARVTAACQAAGCPLGIFGVNAAAVRPYIDQGFSLLVVGVDAMLLATAAAGLVRELAG